MGLRYSLNVCLIVLAAAVVLAPNGHAQLHANQASASIRATATVVSAMGITAPEDDLVRLSGHETIGVRSLGEKAESTGVLSLHRLLVRYPSQSSTMVSIESGHQEIDRFSLEQWNSMSKADHTTGLSRPGAMLLDLCETCQEINSPDDELVVTLIYTEN